MASLMAEAQQGTIGVPRECVPIVNECIAVIEMADQAIKEKMYETELEKQLRQSLEGRNADIEKRLEEATKWYKRPEVVAPVTFFLGLTAGALLKGR